MTERDLWTRKLRLGDVARITAAIATAALLLATAAPPAAAQTATIHRDAWGAPHVLSDTDEGAVYGMAWALAEDDWPLIEANYLHALGRYAELVGEPGVPDDWMARALEIVPLSIREYDDASPRLRGLLDAFAAGLNAWLATRPADELRVLSRIEPWYPLALIRYKYYQNEYLGYAGLRDGWADRAMAASERAAAQGLELTGVAARPGGHAAPGADPRPRYHDAQFDRLGFRPRGSNQWALAPSRTASGHAFLLINPHQSFVGVQRYAEIHLDSREGLRFSGLTVFGFLLPYMGHNEVLGWAYTDNYADHSDLYAETFDDGDPLRYRWGDGHRSAVAWTDSVRVRTGAGLETRRFRYLRTHHGPIVGVDDRGRPLAAKLARYREGGWFDQWDAMIRARSLDEWRRAMAMLRVAYMNTMYADRAGNIGYIYASAVPRRLPGVDPRGVLDGSDPDTEWQGFHALDELPQVFNPSTGWLLNTNSTPFTATTELPYAPGDFPTYMVGPETDNARARSSRRVLQAMDGVTFDGFARAVWDSRLSVADEVVPALVAEWDATGRPELASVVERLRAWDRVADTASVETTWFVLMAENRRLEDHRAWLPALADALDALRAEWGTIEVPWGRISRHQRPLPGQPVALDMTRPSLPVGGAAGWLGSVFSYYTDDAGSPAPRLGRGGNSFVKVIEFAPVPRALSVLNYGQSGDPLSPHFFDQASLYSRRRFKPAWFSREAVEANAVESYVVGRSGG
jgi:acyl-homoserine lactone acylase PvdQ